jgi:TetR/AcrR family transcriptional regulator, mexJK operon transcriptional repressor
MNAMMTNRERLLLAAREIFLEQGYDANVAAIICRAEVARQTFYNHFKNKESLFAEVIRDIFLDILAPLNGHPDDLRQSLVNFAEIYRQRALNPEGIAAYRILISQAQRFPKLVQELYALGTGQMVERLADFLRKAMEQGHIRHADAVFAAGLLMAMLVGQERSQLLFGVQRSPEDESLKVATVVDGFLRIFAPEQTNT